MRLLGLDTHLAFPDTSHKHQFHRGLIMVQIDGLGHLEFQRALSHNEMPFLKQLIERQHYDIHSLYSGIPSSTPAVQAELFYGVKSAVPAFAFVNHITGKDQRMLDADSASAIEAYLAELGRPLLKGGSAYSNIYTGGAAESHYCAASLGFGHSLKAFEPLARIGIGLIFLPTFFRTIALVVVELALAIVDSLKGIANGQRVLPELKFVLARVAICIGLRDAVSIGAQVDIIRGLPIVHLNLLGYDEQAHRRGPHSAFAHWTLRGIDRCLKRLWQASNESPIRHYDLWIYSDHGQESTEPYVSRTGVNLPEAIADAMEGLGIESTKDKLDVPKQELSSARARFLGGRILQKLLPTTLELLDNSHLPKVRIAAMGPIGHLYSDAFISATNRTALASYMSSTGKVPAVMYLNAKEEVIVQTNDALYHLPADTLLFAGEAHKFAGLIGDDLVSLCRHKDSGQVILLGWANNASPLSFPFENGAHAGPGSCETHAFALLPADTDITSKSNEGLRMLDLRNAAFSILDQDPDLATSNRFPRARGLQSVPNTEQTLRHQQYAHNDKTTEQKSFRLMTYNVHGCIGMDGRHAPERIARVIAHFEPDIVALQELDVNRSRSRGTDQAETIARLLEMQYHFHPSMHVESGAYGNAILTHFPLHIEKAKQLPTHPTKLSVEPRGAIWATIAIGDLKLQVVCTHLGLYPEERLQQINMLQSHEWLDQAAFHAEPAVLCGDFNATPGSAALRALNTSWKDAQMNHSSLHTSNYKTFTSMMPALRIDHVFTNERLQVRGVQVPQFELARRASDHLPLIVDLDLSLDGLSQAVKNETAVKKH